MLIVKYCLPTDLQELIHNHLQSVVINLLSDNNSDDRNRVLLSLTATKNP